MGQLSTSGRGQDQREAATSPQRGVSPWLGNAPGGRGNIIAASDLHNRAAGRTPCWHPGQKLVTNWKFVGDGHGAYAPVQYGFVGDGAGCFEQEVVAVVSDDFWSKVLFCASIVAITSLSALAGVAIVRAMPSLLVWAPQGFQAMGDTLRPHEMLPTQAHNKPSVSTTPAVVFHAPLIYDCTLPTAPPVLPAPLGSMDVGGGRLQPVYTPRQQKLFGVDERGNPSGSSLSTWPVEQRLWCCKSEGVGCMTVSDVAPQI